MTRDEIVARLKEIRRSILEIADTTDSPGLERTLRAIDENCHFAEWQLGETDGLVPEMRISSTGSQI